MANRIAAAFAAVLLIGSPLAIAGGCASFEQSIPKPATVREAYAEAEALFIGAASLAADLGRSGVLTPSQIADLIPAFEDASTALDAANAYLIDGEDAIAEQIINKLSPDLRALVRKVAALRDAFKAVQQ